MYASPVLNGNYMCKLYVGISSRQLTFVEPCWMHTTALSLPND